MIHIIYQVTRGCTVRVTRAGVLYFTVFENFAAGRVGYAAGAW